MKDNYIECSVEDCTHARLASGEVVEVIRALEPGQKYIDMAKWFDALAVPELLYSPHWPRLSITPVKLAPKPEPRKWEFVGDVSYGPANWIYTPCDIPPRIKVRVTLEEIL